jgi:REP element-mobilizing transposase RayT
MVATHIHVLARAHPLAEIPKMIGRMKGVTSRLAKVEEIAPLAWADGYDIESVSPGDDATLRHYLRAQPFRHPSEAIDGWAGDTFALDETV